MEVLVSTAPTPRLPTERDTAVQRLTPVDRRAGKTLAEMKRDTDRDFFLGAYEVSLSSAW